MQQFKITKRISQQAQKGLSSVSENNFSRRHMKKYLFNPDRTLMRENIRDFYQIKLNKLANECGSMDPCEVWMSQR